MHFAFLPGGRPAGQHGYQSWEGHSRGRKVPRSSKEDCFASRSVLGRREELSRVLLRYNSEVRFCESSRFSRPTSRNKFRALFCSCATLRTNQEEILPCKHLITIKVIILASDSCIYRVARKLSAVSHHHSYHQRHILSFELRTLSDYEEGMVEF